MTGTGGPGEDFRVVEITNVCDEEIEAELNRRHAEGYRFESIHFVTQPGSRRPQMAFLFFTRPREGGGSGL